MKKGLINVILTLLMILIIMLLIGAVEKVEKEYLGGFNTYTVLPGETLWSIAGDIESDKDIREIIYIIKKDNNMTESNINAWQELKLRNEY